MVLAVAAYRTVGAALERAARDQVRLAAKRIGLVISDRLEVVERAVQLAAHAVATDALPPDTGDPGRSRLEAVQIVRPNGARVQRWGSPFLVPPLGVSQAAHLAAGRTVLTVAPDSGAPAVYMVRMLPDTGGTVWGRLSPPVIDELLTVETADSPETTVCVVSLPDGVRLACQPAGVAIAALSPAIADSAVGGFEWSASGSAFLAGFWSLFLDYRYAAPDWRVIYSQSRAAALEPLALFRQAFALGAVLVVLTVAFLGTVQLRRTMAPLRALHDGTIRLARRDFDHPVLVRSGDELEDVARGFNDMARHLQLQFAEAERLAGELGQVSDELRVREALLRAVLESAADGIVAVGDDGRIRSLNRAAERLFGWERGAAEGRPFAELFSTPIGEGPAGLVVTPGVGSPSLEIVARRRSGTTFSAELTFGRAEAGGEVLHTVFVRDVGDRKRAAEEQERLEAQLRHAQKMETIGTLAGGIAHDFNNLLMPILGHVELVLASVPPDSELRGDLEPMRDAARRARDLVKRILTFARGTEQAFGPVRLPVVVDESVRLLRSSIPSTIAIRTEIAVDVAPIEGDGSQIHQVIMNLCTNAYHAMRDRGGQLEVLLDMAPIDPSLAALHPGLAGAAVVRLQVRDTGHGMDRATLERVFEPFFTTKPAGEGTGLGMAIVHGVVTSHRGAITVASEPGVGTTFTVYFPPARTVDAVGAPVRGPEMTTGEGRVLVVDDDDVVGRLVTRVLERAGYQVTRTISPVEALDQLLVPDTACDLLITDQTMPGLTGIQLAQRVRAARPELPIILMTGYSELASQGSIELLGINELLVKPVEIVPLAATVARVIHASRAGPAGATASDGS
jgi:PAS domain S-box-containing protein